MACLNVLVGGSAVQIPQQVTVLLGSVAVRLIPLQLVFFFKQKTAYEIVM